MVVSANAAASITTWGSRTGARLQLPPPHAYERRYFYMKKQFKSESKRLLDLMINSIYTNKEIFLRELISNASDAIDKRYFLEASGGKTGMSRDDYEIRITPDKDGRTLTISDNGIGMSADEMENNLGTIAESGSFKFKSENKDKEDDTDIIGQFGVGFYSAFMVSGKIEVLSRRVDS